MLNRVNTYLKRTPFLGALFGRLSPQPSSKGLCSLRVGAHDATLLFTSNPFEKIEISLCKSFTYTTINELVSALSSEIRINKLEGVSCSWMLDPPNYHLMLLEDLPVEENEFQSAIRWKIKNLLPFSIDDAVVDSFPMPVQKTLRPQKMIMVVVAQTSYLQSIIQPIQKCGLNINMIDIPELGLRNITAILEQTDRSTALIYAHGNMINLIITYQKQLYLTRRIDFEFDSNNVNSDENNKSIEKLALEIQRSFDYFQSQWRISEPSSVYFASSKSPGVISKIIETLSNYLVTPVNNLDIDLITVNTAHLSKEDRSRHLPLIGGLLREEIIKHATTD